jgi:hypothetical protein
MIVSPGKEDVFTPGDQVGAEDGRVVVVELEEIGVAESRLCGKVIEPHHDRSRLSADVRIDVCGSDQLGFDPGRRRWQRLRIVAAAAANGKDRTCRKGRHQPPAQGCPHSSPFPAFNAGPYWTVLRRPARYLSYASPNTR